MAENRDKSEKENAESVLNDVSEKNVKGALPLTSLKRSLFKRFIKEDSKCNRKVSDRCFLWRNDSKILIAVAIYQD